MESLNRLITEGTNPESREYITPHVAGVIVGQGGKILWQHASSFGGNEDGAVTMDTVFWLASQSKLMTTVAALKTVESGLIGLDDDVSSVLPELAALEVLDGGEKADGTPSTKPRKNKITLRHLLSHQSGVGYESMPESLAKWAAATNLINTTLDSTQISMKSCPLAFEPGTSWSYGAGIDWAGELIARLNKSTLEDYYEANIWKPLGMAKCTYYPKKYEADIVPPYARNNDGIPQPQALPLPLEPERETAGHGVWGSPSDYAKLLAALLDGGSPILSAASVNEIFMPQEHNTDALVSMIHGIYKPALGPLLPQGEAVHHGLAGVINPNDFPGRRKSGTLQWSGMPNLTWWIDRKTGIAATIFMQLMPCGDPKAVEFARRFEEAVYKAVNV